MNIVKCDDLIILVKDFRWQLARRDFAENAVRVGHESEARKSYREV